MKATILSALLFTMLSGFGQGSSIEGYWMHESGDYIVQIADNPSELNGEIVWLNEPMDNSGELRRDVMNKEPELRSRLILGINALEGFEPDDDAWRSGKIYDLKSGHLYNGRLKLDGTDRLRVTGYYGILFFLGKTKVWTRVADPSEYDLN